MGRACCGVRPGLILEEKGQDMEMAWRWGEREWGWG